MPKLIIGGKIINVRWLKEWDKQVILIGKTFKNKAGYIDWQTAFDQGYLKGLPKLRLYDYSKRHTAIKMSKKPGYKAKRLEYNRKYKQIQSKAGTKFRKNLFCGGSLDTLRKKHACPPRDLWTEEQKDILKAIIIAHPRGMRQIDWDGVMQDNLINRLPKKYQKKLPLLRKYYHGLCQCENPKLLKKRRKDSLRWKNENKEQYLRNVSRRKKKISQVTNEYFLTKIPLFD